MKEIREGKVLFNKSGGTSTAIKRKVDIPTPWADDMGVTIDDRDVIREYDYETKTLKIYKKPIDSGNH